MNPEFFDIPKIPINGTLDLHGFQPSETKELVEEYLNVCFDENITQGRIIHGKGIGTQQRIVHSVLKKHPKVADFFWGTRNLEAGDRLHLKLITKKFYQKAGE